MNFNNVIKKIGHAHKALFRCVEKTVDKRLTTRSWLIGYYIQKYEIGGKDRAEYGAQLLEKLIEQLQKEKVTSCSGI